MARLVQERTIKVIFLYFLVGFLLGHLVGVLIYRTVDMIFIPIGWYLDWRDPQLRQIRAFIRELEETN